MALRRLPVPFLVMMMLVVWSTVSFAAPAAPPVEPPATHIAAPHAPPPAAPAAPKPAMNAIAAHEAAPAAPAAPAVAAPKTNELHLGRFYFKSTTQTDESGNKSTVRSWGFGAKADGTGRSFDRSTVKNVGTDGNGTSKTVTSLAKIDAKGAGTQRTFTKDTVKDASGSYTDKSRSTVKTAVKEDGTKIVNSYAKSDTRLIGADGAASREIVIKRSNTDANTGVVTTSEKRKVTDATAPVAPAPASASASAPAARLTAHESDKDQLARVGVVKTVDSRGQARFRDATSGKFVAAADVDKRLAPTETN